MQKIKRIKIAGDINVGIASSISTLLKQHKIDAELELGDLSKSANIIPDPYMFTYAASIAAVLSFLIEIWKLFRERKRNFKQSSKINEVSLEHQLQSFCAEGFEVINIKGINKNNFECQDNISITLNDVPGKQTIIVEILNGYHVKIQRNKS